MKLEQHQILNVGKIMDKSMVYCLCEMYHTPWYKMYYYFFYYAKAEGPIIL